MRKNLLFKGEGTLLGRKNSLCQAVLTQKILVYSSTAFRDVKEDAVLREREKIQGKRQRAV